MFLLSWKISNRPKASINNDEDDEYCRGALQWYYKAATRFADRFWPYKGVSLYRQVDLVTKYHINAEGSGLILQYANVLHIYFVLLLMIVF